MRCSLPSSSLFFGITTAQFAGPYLLGSYFGIPLKNETFDYVNVGGGTAGLVVANRLTENPNITVAVVEPGSFYEISHGNQSQIPFYSTMYVSANPTECPALNRLGTTYGSATGES